MNWPREITAAFLHALEIEPVEGLTPEEVVQALCDEAARRAVWRAECDPARMSGFLRWPYTPLGSLVNEGMGGRANRFTLHGDRWGPAVDLFHGYIEQNAALICEVFRDEQEPYN